VGGVGATFSEGIPGGLGSVGGTPGFNTNEAGAGIFTPPNTALVDFVEGSGGYGGLGGLSGTGASGLGGFAQHGAGFAAPSVGGTGGNVVSGFAGGSGGGGGGTGGGGPGGNGGQGGNGGVNGGVGFTPLNNTGGGGGGGGGGGNGGAAGGIGGSGANGQLTVFWFQGSAGPPGPPVAFVWQPGGPSQQGNLYTSWSALMAAANAVQGISIVLVDNTFAAANVPAGTWNVDNVQFYGKTTSTGVSPVMTFLDGAKVTFSTVYFTDIIVKSSSTSHVATFNGVGGLMSLTNATLLSTSTAPFVQVTGAAGSNFNLITQGGECDIGDGTHSTIQVDSPTSIETDLSNHTILFANATSGTGAIQLVFDDNVTLQTPQMAGMVFFPQGQATNVTYAPALVGNWSGTAPTSVANALDRIAAKIGPIP